MENKNYALITGASQGIGRAMARECASRGMNILLVALDEPALYRTAEEINSSFGVAVDHFGVDLAADHAPESVYSWCQEQGYDVNVLINNAGFGRSGIFEKGNLPEYNTMMRLNNQAVVGLTYHFLPHLQQQPWARIMNMSSMEATMPLPYKSVYTGTKNFIYTFSLALREELKTTNIRVSTLCPGPTLTNEDGLKRIKSQGKRAQLLLMMPEQVAPTAIDGMLRGQAVIIPGNINKAIVRLMGLFPTSLKMSILERIFRRYKYEHAQGVNNSPSVPSR